ncbi:MAG: hypothetical protein WC264_01940 [Candidatus Paceibacterota bacterium]|jgi:hypothetical protein
MKEGKLNQIKKETFKEERWDIEKSFLDKENKCVRIPIIDKGIYIDTDVIWEMGDELKKKYPILNFSGEWHTLEKEGKREYLFCFK